MKKTSFFILFFCFVSALFAQGQEERKPGSFNGFSLAGSFNVELQEGNEEKVKILSSDIPMEQIITEVENNTLKIHRKKGYSGKANVKILVVYKKLSSVSSGGSGTISSSGSIKSDKFTLSLAGSGNISLKLDATSVSMSLAGSGNLNISGSTDKQSIDVAGSGNVKAEDLKSKEASVSIAGSGDVYVNVSGKLKVSIAGSGDVLFKGKPELEVKSVGSGKVQSM